MTGVGHSQDSPIQTIAPGVMVIHHGHVEGKTGVVAGSEAAVVIDTGPQPDHGTLISAALLDFEVPCSGTILTHGHWDHVLGGSFGARVYAHVKTGDLMESTLADMARITGRSEGEIAATLPWPTDTLAKRRSINLGARSIELIATPGHSPDSICVFVPDCGVLFAGDTVVTCIPPVFRDGNSRQIVATLGSLADESRITTIVPGHGNLATNHGVIDVLEWPQSYINSLRSAITPMISAPEEAIFRYLTYEKYIGGRFDRTQYRMDWRHRLTIRSLLAEASNLPSDHRVS